MANTKMNNSSNVEIKKENYCNKCREKLVGHLIGGGSPSAYVDGKEIGPVTWTKWEEYCPRCDRWRVVYWPRIMMCIVLMLFLLIIFLGAYLVYLFAKK